MSEQQEEAKNGVGRPSVMTKEVLNILDMGFMMDYTDEEACLFAGISPKTLYNYQEKNPEFVQRKHMLRRTLSMKAKFIVAQYLNPEMFMGENGNPKVKFAEGGVDLAMTYLQNKYPEEFGKRRAYSSDLEEKMKQQTDEAGQILRKFKALLEGADREV